MKNAKLSAPLHAYLELLKGRNALNMDLMREAAQVKSRSSTLKMAEIFEESVQSRIPRQEILDQELGLLGGAKPKRSTYLFNSTGNLSPTHCPLGREKQTSQVMRTELFSVNEVSYFSQGRRLTDQSEPLAEKQMSAVAASSRNIARWKENDFVLSGFLNKIKIPPISSSPAQLYFCSWLQSQFSWVEANALLPGANVALGAIAHIAVASNGQLFYSNQRLVGLQSSYEQVHSHNDLATDCPQAAFSMKLEIDAQEGAEIDVLEFVELSATQQNGHAYISGLFNWDPLKIRLGDASQPSRATDGLNNNSHFCQIPVG